MHSCLIMCQVAGHDMHKAESQGRWQSGWGQGQRGGGSLVWKVSREGWRGRLSENDGRDNFLFLSNFHLCDPLNASLVESEQQLHLPQLNREEYQNQVGNTASTFASIEQRLEDWQWVKQYKKQSAYGHCGVNLKNYNQIKLQVLRRKTKREAVPDELKLTCLSKLDHTPDWFDSFFRVPLSRTSNDCCSLHMWRTSSLARRHSESASGSNFSCAGHINQLQLICRCHWCQWESQASETHTPVS